MGAQAEIRAVDNVIESAMQQSDIEQNSLSLWDSFKIAIMPESHGESIVNEIYSSPSRTLKSDPAYDRNDLSSPNVYVKAKGAIADTISAYSGFAGMGLLIVGAFLLLLVFVYAAAPAIVRR